MVPEIILFEDILCKIIDVIKTRESYLIQYMCEDCLMKKNYLYIDTN